MTKKSFVRKPDSIRLVTDTEMIDGKDSTYQAADVEVEVVFKDDVLEAYLTAGEASVREVIFCWKEVMQDAGVILGDHWERGYGDLEWKQADKVAFMPWYFAEDKGDSCRCFGVKVRPGAICWWEKDGESILLHLDVRCGGEGVLLKGRKLKMAEILMRQYETENTFAAVQSFCESMSDSPISYGKPVYGSNNWYYAYGNSSREEILRDTEYLAELTKGNENRPFMVIDDGWQTAHTGSYNGGPWNEGNPDYGDMGQLAQDMKKYDVHPGIWFRPLYDTFDKLPAEWRLERDATVIDISIPEVLEYVKADVRRICEWGYELIKHDFSTCDIFGGWGFEFGTRLTKSGWRFKDVTRTSAEIITDFYRAIKEAAGDVLILGCNCIGHLAAGLMEANRTGDDTSGMEWERTKKMGVNTLAFRMAQHGSFFGADADCVGITEKVPWEKNRQWMEILSLSGTPFFVSVKPGLLNGEQEEELKTAYRKASENTEIAVPIDWKEGKTPQKWKTFEGIKEYEW